MSVLSVVALAGFAVTAGMLGTAAWRRRLRSGVAGDDVAAAQRRRLVANWHEVEQAALRGGMTPDEIAAVRERLLG